VKAFNILGSSSSTIVRSVIPKKPVETGDVVVIDQTSESSSSIGAVIGGVVVVAVVAVVITAIVCYVRIKRQNSPKAVQPDQQNYGDNQVPVVAVGPQNIQRVSSVNIVIPTTEHDIRHPAKLTQSNVIEEEQDSVYPLVKN
jgi:hypothetical protein